MQIRAEQGVKKGGTKRTIGQGARVQCLRTKVDLVSSKVGRNHAGDERGLERAWKVELLEPSGPN